MANEKLKVIHNLSPEVIKAFEMLGTIADENDGRYYNLPQWFKKDKNGTITEVPFKELPDNVKHIHLHYRDYQRVFTLDEMKDAFNAGELRGNDYITGWGYNNNNNDIDSYFKEKFNIDL